MGSGFKLPTYRLLGKIRQGPLLRSLFGFWLAWQRGVLVRWQEAWADKVDDEEQAEADDGFRRGKGARKLGEVDVRRKGERWEDWLDKKAAAGEGAKVQAARASGKGKSREKAGAGAGAGAEQKGGERRQVQQALRELRQMARIERRKKEEEREMEEGRELGKHA